MYVLYCNLAAVSRSQLQLLAAAIFPGYLLPMYTFFRRYLPLSFSGYLQYMYTLFRRDIPLAFKCMVVVLKNFWCNGGDECTLMACLDPRSNTPQL